MVRWLTVIAVAILVPGAFYSGWQRVHIETDITTAMPDSDPVVASARRILGRHPALDLVTIDLGMTDGPADPDRLVTAAGFVQQRLERSGLFDRVGTEDAARAMPRLFATVLQHLPQMFDAGQLERQVAGRLAPEKIREALEQNLSELAELSGVGQANAFARDPLRLRELVLMRLASLSPAPGVRIYKTKILSADGRHLLLVADPRAAGGDTAQGRKLVALLDRIRNELPAALGAGPEVRLTVVGAFRAALDNETIVRADTQRAVWVASIGVALLLLLCFPRPWLGLLALVPAISGAALALFVYSLIEPTISALALGFGGALITITVDHGIAYLQFLDRQQETSGRQAAREVWSVGLFAALTTVGAFLTLYVSGFDMLGQVGLFAALGVGFSFLFVHTVFPGIFPHMKAARRGSLLPVHRLLAALTVERGWPVAACAVALAVAAAVFGRPEFVVDLRSMNTVERSTIEAEQRMSGVWGNIFGRTYVMLEGESLHQLRDRTDKLADFLAAERGAGVLASGFSPSQVLPGPQRAGANLRAWQEFFKPQRAAEVRGELVRVGQEMGFARDAFEPFLRSIENPKAGPPEIPEGMYEMLGLAASAGGGWVWLGSVEPGAGYDAEKFCNRAARAGIAVFDPDLFTDRLSNLLGSSFLKILAVVGLAVLGFLIILFFDWALVLITSLPLVFALVCTLGAMKLVGHPLDIPGLMLAIVVLGMGVDYSLYFVRGQQRYLDPRNPSLRPVRMAVFLAASSTMVGLGTLAMADHAVPRSAGLTMLMGIGFALVGTFALLPPVLNRLFAARPFASEAVRVGSSRHRRLVRARYRHLEPQARLFARFKIKLDPMFARLAELVGPADSVLDVGCGLGVPAVWLLAARPEMKVHGIDPDPARVRVAARAVGDRGEVRCAAAPDLGDAAGPFDAALLIDVVHQLTDEDLARTLERLRTRLAPGGRLIVRADVPGAGRFALERWLETLRLRGTGRKPHYRSLAQLTSAIERAGLSVVHTEPTAPGREETWLVAGQRETSS